MVGSGLDELEVGIVLVGEGRDIVQVNRAARALLGALGVRVEPGTHVSAVLDALPTPLARDVVTDLPAGDDRVVAARFTGGAIELRDVTCERRLAASATQAQKLEALGMLASGIAHDFSNLLTVIMGEAELLSASAPEGSDAAQSVTDILTAGRRATELTRDLLAFARRGDYARGSVDVNAMVRETARLLARSLDRGIRVECATAPEDLLVGVDPTQLQATLLNLAINARDAMPQGGTLTVETSARDLEKADEAASGANIPAGRYAEIAVSDTGTGIAPDLLPRIFERYFTTKPRGEGTGLGLAAVNDFAVALGGGVRVWTEQGRGTTFRLFIPRAAASSVPPSAGR